MRIVSLVPSLTETLCRFGLKENLVGCTNYCVEPKGLHRVAQLIGGTKNPDLEPIKKLNPTHILVNLEENKPEHIEACKKIASTYECLPKTLDDVEPLLISLGEFLDAKEIGLSFANKFNQARKSLQEKAKASKPKKYLYFIWQNPWMVAGSDTYISSLFDEIHWINVAPKTESRYPELSVEQMAGLGAEVLFLSSEPYPFRNRDIENLKSVWPNVPEIKKIDGRLMSWYGTMSLDVIDYLNEFICRRSSRGM